MKRIFAVTLLLVVRFGGYGRRARPHTTRGETDEATHRRDGPVSRWARPYTARSETDEAAHAVRRGLSQILSKTGGRCDKLLPAL